MTAPRANNQLNYENYGGRLLIHGIQTLSHYWGQTLNVSRSWAIGINGR